MGVYVGRGDSGGIVISGRERASGHGRGRGGVLLCYVYYIRYICYTCYIRHKIVIYSKPKNKIVKFLKLLLKDKGRNFLDIIYLSMRSSISLREYVFSLR